MEGLDRRPEAREALGEAELRAEEAGEAEVREQTNPRRYPHPRSEPQRGCLQKATLPLPR